MPTLRSSIESMMVDEFRRRLKGGVKLSQVKTRASVNDPVPTILRQRQAAAMKGLRQVVTAREQLVRSLPFARGDRKMKMAAQAAALGEKADELAKEAADPSLTADEVVTVFRGQIQDTAKAVAAGVETAALVQRSVGPIDADVPEAVEAFPAPADWDMVVPGEGPVISLDAAQSVPGLLGSLPGQSRPVPSGVDLAFPGRMRRLFRRVRRRRVAAPALGQDVRRGAASFGQDVRRGAASFGYVGTGAGRYVVPIRRSRALDVEEGLDVEAGLDAAEGLDVGGGVAAFGFTSAGTPKRSSAKAARYHEEAWDTEGESGLDVEAGLDVEEGIDIDEGSQVFGDLYGSGAEAEPVSWD